MRNTAWAKSMENNISVKFSFKFLKKWKFKKIFIPVRIWNEPFLPPNTKLIRVTPFYIFIYIGPLTVFIQVGDYVLLGGAID